VFGRRRRHDPRVDEASRAMAVELLERLATAPRELAVTRDALTRAAAARQSKSVRPTTA
jgi:hypothetical protein